MTERRISHYRVLEELSRGGMGIVYRAIDTKLDREVALKVLPPELVADPERKRRFVQEAKAAAALHHPHIATIFEIDEAEETTFIAMELIQGAKLSELLQQERLPVARILELATEMAEGLSKAHEKNIVHRDLKPANIMISEDGHIKIIDFGLAKLIEPLGGADSIEDTALRETEPGRILGTVAYMSPEQARGKTVDHRSDIFSFGIALFEMLSGRVPFEGPSGVETLNAILREPAPSLPGAPPELQRIVHRCLAKDPGERYQTTKDLLSELRRIRRDSESTVSLATPPRTRRWLVPAAATAFAVVSVVVYLRRTEPESVPRLIDPVQVTSALGSETYPTWSPDGGRLAYASNTAGLGSRDIWVTQLSGGEPVNFTPDYPGDDYYPSWSPDGSQIVFASTREGGGYFVMSALGGKPRKLRAALGPTFGRPLWSSDGSKLAWMVRDANRVWTLESLTLQGRETEHIPVRGLAAGPADLSWSPDGRFFAYVDAVDISAEITQIWILRPDGERFAVTDGTTQDWSPSWSSDGAHLFYVSNRGGGSMDLWQQRIARDGAPVGEPERITTGIGMRSAAFSPDGSKLAYTSGRGVVSNVWRVPILSDRRAGWSDAVQLTFDQAFIEFLDLSPDGTRIALSSDRAGNQDLWTFPAGGGELTRLTDDPTPDWRPAWSPDGKEIAFYAYRSGNRDIWVMPLDGSSPRPITNHEASDLHPSWSPDGKQIAFASTRGGSFGVWIASANGGDATVLADAPGDNLPAWSPDGKWVTFRSGRSGGPRIWRAPAAGGEPEQLTNGTSAGQPRWSPDGREIYFGGGGDRGPDIWALRLEDRSERPLTDFAGRPGTLGNFALATDGAYLYFTWEEDVGDLWVMDVAEEGS